ncbi:alpha/beta fold hydrolase [Pseudoroseicyclus tamaricis]|uniref:Alpha/beta hydrolase n=1 Tax=Pseudoroseicyclus tamaricis TaxID=2705421 RepID=A0A6B2JW55_9RHOB|nr:alpha/beta hydrolase [Pseudoroseicyclus tamaricis]NDV02727.1 alpha/beta hydrolase [Pseudoroseicyclus tamaricis]
MEPTLNASSRPRLHVNDTGGTGRPVVLIHGWPLSSAAWEKQVPALTEKGYRVISYDRRGFGASDKPEGGYDYDTMTDDLAALLEEKDLRDVTLVGFSMGGGEVARYVGAHGEERLHSIVFASAVPPYLMQTADNPSGPLTEDAAKEMEDGLKAGRAAFFDDFTKNFFSAGDELKVSEEDRQKAIRLCEQSDQTAALACMEAFGTTDFREDLEKITVPTLVLHGDADGIVPVEGSGLRTHKAVAHSRLALIQDAPHGCNVSHPQAFNDALIEFLEQG